MLVIQVADAGSLCRMYQAGQRSSTAGRPAEHLYCSTQCPQGDNISFTGSGRRDTFIHICTKFLCLQIFSLIKGLAENKSTLGPEEVRKSALALVMGALDNPNPILRCAAGEALGRMAQVVGEATFIARMAQTSFDK